MYNNKVRIVWKDLNKNSINYGEWYVNNRKTNDLLEYWVKYENEKYKDKIFHYLEYQF